MNTSRNKLTPALWAFAVNAALWASLLLLCSYVSGCDAPLVDAALDQVPGQGDGLPPSSECGTDLFDSVEARAELLACHSECATLQLDCMGEPAPSCYACEHEAAICRSTCPEPVL